MTTTDQLSGLDLLRALAGTEQRTGIWTLLGLHDPHIDRGHVSFAITTRPDFANPLGALHGGICATLLDSVMGCAVHTTLPPGTGYSTLELKVNYIRTVPTDGTRLIGTGHVIHAGRTTATAEGRVTDDQDRLVAHATTTCLIHHPQPGTRA